MPFGKKKRMTPEEFKPYIVERAVGTQEQPGYLVKIREFLTQEYSSRQEMLDTFSELVKTIERPVDELQKHSPMEKALYLASLGIASVDLRNKDVVKAFLNAEDSPTDGSGNPRMLSAMYCTLMMLLDSTFMGVKGFLEWSDMVGTHYHTLGEDADKALGDRTIRAPADLRKLIPLIDEIEKNLE
jgi:hypothetical protein